MRYSFKSVLIVLAVLFSMSTFCYADPQTVLDRQNGFRLFEDNAAMGTSGMDDYFSDLTEDNPIIGKFDVAASCCDIGADKGCAPFTPKKKSIALGDIHKYLGYSTVILAGLAAVSSGSKGVHYGAAYGSAAAAAGTLATGYLEYGDRFDPGYGLFSEDNAHIILGTIGAVACIAAVAMAESHGGGGGHAGAGIVGGSAMALSIITIKW